MGVQLGEANLVEVRPGRRSEIQDDTESQTTVLVRVMMMQPVAKR